MVDLDCLLQFLQNIEKKYPVSRWEINGVHIWPLLRVTIGNIREKIVIDSSQTRIKRALGRWTNWGSVLEKTIVGELKLFILDYEHHQKLGKHDVVFFGDSMDRDILLPTGEWMDHNTDPIQDQLEKHGYKVFRFERIWNGVSRYPRWSKSFPIGSSIIKELIRKKLLPREGYIQTNVDQYDYFFQDVQSFWGEKAEELRLSNIVREVTALQKMAKVIADKLRVIAPRLIVIKNWYGQMEVLYAAHMLHIPVVDIQHGVIQKFFAYSGWSELPPSGYALMPDYFWVWDEDDYEEVFSWSKKIVKPIIGGVPRNIIFCDVTNTFSMMLQKEYEFLFSSFRPLLLLSLQCIDNYPEWLAKFINETEKYTWLIRLHPRDSVGQRRLLSLLDKRENIKWKRVEEVPLELLLQNVSLHITMFSAVVKEGEIWGCPSIVLHPDAEEYFAPQFASGIARYADNPDDLLAAIEEILSNKEWGRGIERRRKELYCRGMNGVKELIKIMETRQ